MTMFEKASRLKLRFSTTKGLLSVEDLWDLSLTDINKLAVALNKELKEVSEESFITKRSPSTTILSLRFDIVKYIIDVRLEETEKKEKALIDKAKKDKIKSIIAKKQDAELEDMDIADLKAML